ncbi:hypothetical protein AC629_31045 [Bradyrhizobium sp. NAS80.1]|uniref:hypothetical protein n=1 Tax=Bradyrhizobium sp. NAS80.1 TaxID=1680159 RepID=UPI00095FD7A6|nr:hypothetical protein [Bradyrhizobium sp. NAS80.1]OKO77930.1 hypothetical protein AC629_31045 [Bradyrhizobium sp. NAS80.1]
MIRTAAVVAAAVWSTMALALFLWRIEPLLPARGGSTCFAADYSPARPVDLSSPRRDHRSIGEVSSTRLAIHFLPGEHPFRSGTPGLDYDWRYVLKLEARLVNGELLTSEAFCNRSDTFGDRIMPALFCDIDCDGGTITLWRNIGRSGLTARFEAGERLRTGGSCGEGRPLYIGADQEARSLPADAAPQQTCAE